MEAKFEGCAHFSICNGCPRMDVGYVQQCEQKREYVKSQLVYYVEDLEVEPSPSIQFHRNRADFWFSPQKQLGFRAKADRLQGISVPHCLLISPRAQSAYQFLEAHLRLPGWEPYSVLEQKGFLRYVTFRESKSSGQLVIVFNTFTNTSEDESKIQELAQTLIEKKHADGIAWVHNPEFNDNVQGEIIRTWGNATLNETMSGIPFQYGPMSFFQTNPRAAEKAQALVTERIHVFNPHAHVLDLYCGVGLFSLPLAMKGHLVKGIELSADAITHARKNAHALGIDDDSFSFESGDVPKKLQELEKNTEKFDTIILDPPRSGLSKKIWRRVLRLEPKQLVYVACSITALKRDLEWLEEYAEFKIEHAHAFDFFPHTEHVETVVDIRLTKIKEFPKGG